MQVPVGSTERWLAYSYLSEQLSGVWAVHQGSSGRKGPRSGSERGRDLEPEAAARVVRASWLEATSTYDPEKFSKYDSVALSTKCAVL